MEWTEVNIYTSAEGIELLCAKLMDIGVKGFVIKDSEDFKELTTSDASNNPGRLRARVEYVRDQLLKNSK